MKALTTTFHPTWHWIRTSQQRLIVASLLTVGLIAAVTSLAANTPSKIITITHPKNVSDAFPLQVKVRATAAQPKFNTVVRIDGRVVETRVRTKPFNSKKPPLITYNFHYGNTVKQDPNQIKTIDASLANSDLADVASGEPENVTQEATTPDDLAPTEDTPNDGTGDPETNTAVTEDASDGTVSPTDATDNGDPLSLLNPKAVQTATAATKKKKVVKPTSNKRFDRLLLTPGKHKITAEVRAGTVPGKGKLIGRSAKATLTASKVSSVATGPSGVAKATLQAPALGAAITGTKLPSTATQTSSTGSHSLAKLLSGNVAEAHSSGRHNITLRVKVVPGIVVIVSHPSLSACHSGNSAKAGADGIARFDKCPVSDGNGTTAQYNVTVGASSGEWTLSDDRSKQVRLNHVKYDDVVFNYTQSPTAPPPAPVPAPVPPATHGNGSIGGSPAVAPCTGSNTGNTHGNSVAHGTIKVTVYLDSQNGGTTHDKRLRGVCVSLDKVNSTYNCDRIFAHSSQADGTITFKKCPVGTYKVTTHTPDGYSISGNPEQTITVKANKQAIATSVLKQSANSGTTHGAPSETTDHAATKPAATGEKIGKPFLAITGLSSQHVRVSAFSMRLSSKKAPLGNIVSFTTNVDGQENTVKADSLPSISNHLKHPTIKGALLPIPNISDGKPHTLTVTVNTSKKVIAHQNNGLIPIAEAAALSGETSTVTLNLTPAPTTGTGSSSNSSTASSATASTPVGSQVVTPPGATSPEPSGTAASPIASPNSSSNPAVGGNASATPTPKIVTAAQVSTITGSQGTLLAAQDRFQELPATGQAGLVTFLAFVLIASAYYGTRYWKTKRPKSS